MKAIEQIISNSIFYIKKSPAHQPLLAATQLAKPRTHFGGLDGLCGHLSFRAIFLLSILSIFCLHCSPEQQAGTSNECNQYYEHLQSQKSRLPDHKNLRVSKNLDFALKDPIRCTVSIQGRLSSPARQGASEIVYENLFIHVARQNTEASELLAKRLKELRRKKNLPPDAKVRTRRKQKGYYQITVKNPKGCNRVELLQLKDGLAEILASRVCSPSDQHVPGFSKQIRLIFKGLRDKPR